MINGSYYTWFWGMINKVLPTVYDDSLSYYEVLNKLTKAMAEYGKALDDALEELTTATEEAEASAESAEASALSAQASATATAEEVQNNLALHVFTFATVEGDSGNVCDVVGGNDSEYTTGLQGVKSGKALIISARLQLNEDIQSLHTSQTGEDVKIFGTANSYFMDEDGVIRNHNIYFDRTFIGGYLHHTANSVGSPDIMVNCRVRILNDGIYVERNSDYLLPEGEYDLQMVVGIDRIESIYPNTSGGDEGDNDPVSPTT